MFSKTQKGEKRHEVITSVLFQAPHEHIIQVSVKFVSTVLYHRSSAILDFYGGFRWQLVPRRPFPVPRSPLPVPCFSNTNLLKLNKFCLKYETFQESRLVVARQGTMAGLSKRNLTHNRTCIKDICNETIIFVTSNAFSRSCQLALRLVPC